METLNDFVQGYGADKGIDVSSILASNNGQGIQAQPTTTAPHDIQTQQMPESINKLLPEVDGLMAGTTELELLNFISSLISKFNNISSAQMENNAV